MKRLLIVAIVLGTLFFGAAPAHADGGFYDGQDPYFSGCSQAYPYPFVLDRADMGGVGYVELWWSPACQTNWAVVHNYAGPSEATARVWRSSGGYFQNTFVDSYVHSPMIECSYPLSCMAEGRLYPDWPWYQTVWV